jgi:tetratricopeptide (TPR) repeat protein
MALGDGIRARRLADRAYERYVAHGWAAAEAEVATAPARLAPEAWAQLGVTLENAERRDDARRALQRSRALAPERTDTLLFLADMERDAGNADAAIDQYRALLAAAPGAAMAALDLARLLAVRGAQPEVVEVLRPFSGHVSVELRVLLAGALFETARHAEVIDVTGRIVKDTERDLGGYLAGNLRSELVGYMRDAIQLHDDSFAALHGREQVIKADVHRGRLVANSGANYRLLGEARMSTPPPWTPDTLLRDPDGTAAFGKALMAEGDRSRGLCHLGAAALRLHKLSQARDLFEQARVLNEDNFAAFLGIGAAIDLDQTHALARLEWLPELPAIVPPEMTEVVSDWPVLTSRERIVVHAALAPVARQLPAVVAAGAVARVLPIDARLVDLPAFHRGAGDRLEDERCLDAITGAATAKMCASKVEELLLFSGERGWVFAHELAHLVHFHLPRSMCEELDALFDRIEAQDFVLTNYQTRNVAEFFAVAYEDYLCNHYALPSAREAGFDQMEPVFAFIDRLTR